MKLILSSCDFLNKNSKDVILKNINKELKDNKVLFIPNHNNSIDKIYNRLARDGFTNKDNIYIFDPEKVNDFRNLDLDLIYISGGNTFSMLNKIKKSGFDKDIIKYIKDEVIYIGGSCGAHIVTKNIKHLLDLDDNSINISNFDALGLLDGVIIPHYNEIEYNIEKRKEVHDELIKENKYKVYILTNNDSLVVTDEETIEYKGDNDD